MQACSFHIMVILENNVWIFLQQWWYLCLLSWSHNIMWMSYSRPSGSVTTYGWYTSTKVSTLEVHVLHNAQKGLVRVVCTNYDNSWYYIDLSSSLWPYLPINGWEFKDYFWNSIFYKNYILPKKVDIQTVHNFSIRRFYFIDIIYFFLIKHFSICVILI